MSSENLVKEIDNSPAFEKLGRIYHALHIKNFERKSKTSRELMLPIEKNEKTDDALSQLITEDVIALLKELPDKKALLESMISAGCFHTAKAVFNGIGGDPRAVFSEGYKFLEDTTSSISQGYLVPPRLSEWMKELVEIVLSEPGVSDNDRLLYFAHTPETAIIAKKFIEKGKDEEGLLPCYKATSLAGHNLWSDLIGIAGSIKFHSEESKSSFSQLVIRQLEKDEYIPIEVLSKLSALTEDIAKYVFGRIKYSNSHTTYNGKNAIKEEHEAENFLVAAFKNMSFSDKSNKLNDIYSEIADLVLGDDNSERAKILKSRLQSLEDKILEAMGVNTKKPRRAALPSDKVKEGGEGVLQSAVNVGTSLA